MQKRYAKIKQECSANPEKLNHEGDDDYIEDIIESKNSAAELNKGNSADQATMEPPGSPPPTLSTLLQTHLANISPAPSLSSKRNARLGRKKAKASEDQRDPFKNPVPGTSGTQKRSTRAQTRNVEKD